MRQHSRLPFVFVAIVAAAACVVGDEQPESPEDPARPTYAAHPVGWFDGISAGGLASGWARDPDAPERAIAVHVYVYRADGAVERVYGVTAGQVRSDVGAHGWSLQLPAAYLTAGYRFRAFGIDAVGADANLELSGSPRWYRVSPPTAVLQSACLEGYTWDPVDASYVAANGTRHASGLDRAFNPGKPTVVVLGQSVDILLATALRSIDGSRNYVTVPCDRPSAASFDYGAWTSIIRDWIKPQLPRIDVLSVGITHRALCPTRLAVGDVAVARLRELRALLPSTAIGALGYPSALDRSMSDEAYRAFFACFDPGPTRSYTYETLVPRYRDYVEQASAGVDVAEVWTGTYVTSDGIHPTPDTAAAAARRYLTYLP